MIWWLMNDIIQKNTKDSKTNCLLLSWSLFSPSKRKIQFSNHGSNRARYRSALVRVPGHISTTEHEQSNGRWPQPVCRWWLRWFVEKVGFGLSFHVTNSLNVPLSDTVNGIGMDWVGNDTHIHETVYKCTDMSSKVKPSYYFAKEYCKTAKMVSQLSILQLW